MPHRIFCCVQLAFRLFFYFPGSNFSHLSIFIIIETGQGGEGLREYPVAATGRPFDSAAQGLCGRIRALLFQLPESLKNRAQEIRLRANLPIAVYTGKEVYFLKEQGKITQRFDRTLPTVSAEEIVESFHNCCGYSVYSHQNEIRRGFITMSGGHRVGVCGTAVYDKMEITGIRDISSLNIRIARDVFGAADELVASIDNFTAGVLIAGPPSSGKTTILRDLARQLSLNGKKIAVIDERGELGGSFQGSCWNDLGLSDILIGFPKGEGMLQAVRCLSPDLILCDEAGSRQEISALEEGLNAGVGIITTIHAGSLADVYRRVQGIRLLHSGAFHKIVLLEGKEMPGAVKGMYEVGDPDGKDNRLPPYRADGSNGWISPI